MIIHKTEKHNPSDNKHLTKKQKTSKQQNILCEAITQQYQQVTRLKTQKHKILQTATS